MLSRPYVAGTAVFGALSIVLTVASQGLGLNFPLIPYLQFDLGEVAILLALFIFGPTSALISSVIEFLTLLFIGQNVPVGPLLKLFAIVSSLAGVYAGVRLVSYSKNPGLGKALAMGTALGIVVRGLVMTVPNYYLIVFVFTITGITGFLVGSFALVGINLSEANTLWLVLAFTAIFNALQLLVVSVVSYVVVRSPQVRSAKALGRAPWLFEMLNRTR
ncbi:MAG: ECF transporter S component [Thaumarchaeota archaeon]|nr:ECF transporter S component [Nitrososphaerota archaeon]